MRFEGLRTLSHLRSGGGPRRRLAAAILLAVALLLAHGALAQPPADERLVGRWEGAIRLPQAALAIEVNIDTEATALQGTIDIPQQGARALPLTSIQVTGDKVQFGIQGIPGEPVFEGTLSGTRLEGEFRQNGLAFPFLLERTAAEAKHLQRPQEPHPPFPYREEAVTFESGAGALAAHLAGTLTLPPGEGPFPAVLLLSGSGPQDRNEEIFGHKPFLVLADHLTRAGIAVLRLDDRGVGDSTGDLSQTPLSTLADDAVAGVAWLHKHPAVDGERIGLVGHSEGALVAPLAATRSPGVAFLVLLGAPGVPGHELLIQQTELLSKASGLSPQAIDANLRQLRQVVTLASKDGTLDEVRQEIRALVEEQLTAAPEEQKGQLRQLAESQVQSLTTPWFRSFLRHDPRPVLAKVSVPVLALSGELDLQVPPDPNLTEVEKALGGAGAKDVTVRRLPGLNHLFQTTQTGHPSEYGNLEETFSPEALKIVQEWIEKRFGRRPEAAASP